MSLAEGLSFPQENALYLAHLGALSTGTEPCVNYSSGVSVSWWVPVVQETPLINRVTPWGNCQLKRVLCSLFFCLVPSMWEALSYTKTCPPAFGEFGTQEAEMSLLQLLVGSIT